MVSPGLAHDNWWQCLPVGHTSSSLVGLWDSESTKWCFWQATFAASHKAAEPDCPLARHRRTPGPDSGESTPRRSEPPHSFNHIHFPNNGSNPIHKHRPEWVLLPGCAHAQPGPYLLLICGYHPVVTCHSSHSQGGARILVKYLGSDIHRTAETSRTAMEKFVVTINANKNNSFR